MSMILPGLIGDSGSRLQTILGVHCHHARQKSCRRAWGRPPLILHSGTSTPQHPSIFSEETLPLLETTSLQIFICTQWCQFGLAPCTWGVHLLWNPFVMYMGVFGVGDTSVCTPLAHSQRDMCAFCFCLQASFKSEAWNLEYIFRNLQSTLCKC